MRIRILGCSATACQGRHTTALLVDDDVLVDCGTGVGELNLAQMAAIRHVFLTHSHLDHVLFLPLLSDAALEVRGAPLEVHALPETITALQQHLFNGMLWPDYTSLPAPEHPYIRLHPLRPNAAVSVGSRSFTPLPAQHAVAAVGYLIADDSHAFAFSGDSGDCPAFWEALNRLQHLDYLMIETTLRNSDRQTAQRGGHTTPEILAEGLSRLQRPVELLITHMEADKRTTIEQEIRERLPRLRPRFLQGGEVFTL